jgi:hypothetical protein
MSLQRKLLLVVAALVAMIVPIAASGAPPAGESGDPELVATLPGGAGSGSTVGPGGALYVTQPAAGEIWRIDPASGERTLYASGLPRRFSQLPFGGVMDVAFIGSTAYALVSVVGAQFPADLFACHPQTVGIYRVDGPTSSTVVADIGTFACNNPPPPDIAIVVPTGVQYALETYRGGFLVTDGHHNRVLHVTLDGNVTEMIQFGNIVPTGLAVSGNTVFMAEAGPVPHLPQNGKVVSFEPGSSSVTEVAHGAPLLVDVERGRGRTLFALSQGVFPCGADPACAGSPASHDTGSLVKANANGTFTTIADELDQPTSLELVGTTAYVVTLGGEIWKIVDVSGPPYGESS